MLPPVVGSRVVLASVHALVIVLTPLHPTHAGVCQDITVRQTNYFWSFSLGFEQRFIGPGLSHAW